MNERKRKNSNCAPASRRTYASATMEMRRARIVETAKQLIAEQGSDHFSMCEVASRAGVAERTLYNIVGTRDYLVGQAVSNYQQELATLATLREDSDIADVLSSLAAMCQRLTEERGWGKAIAGLYFSPTVDKATLLSLRAVAQTHIAPAVRMLTGSGEMLDSLEIEMLMHHFTNTAYSLVHDWALGRISDRAFPLHISFAFLVTLSVICPELGRGQMSKLMADLAARLGDDPAERAPSLAEVPPSGTCDA